MGANVNIYTTVTANLLAVNTDIIPVTDNIYTLGNTTYRWESIHIGPGTLYIQDQSNSALNAALTVNNGVLQIDGSNQLQVGQLKFVNNAIESVTGGVNIEIGLTGSSANLVLNRDTTLAAGKSLTLGAGNTTVAPLSFTSGTNLTSPTAGVFEYDSKAFYATPAVSQRGVVPAMQTYYNRNQVDLVNDSSQQSILGLTNGVTVTGGTRYAFTLKFIAQAAADSVNVFFALGGTAVYSGSQVWLDVGKAGFLGSFAAMTRTRTTKTSDGQVRDPSHMSYGLVGGTFWETVIHGTVDVTTTGYLNPILQFSPIPGESPNIQDGAYM
jgi:hypothetical protein